MVAEVEIEFDLHQLAVNCQLFPRIKYHILEQMDMHYTINQMPKYQNSKNASHCTSSSNKVKIPWILCCIKHVYNIINIIIISTIIYYYLLLLITHCSNCEMLILTFTLKSSHFSSNRSGSSGFWSWNVMKCLCFGCVNVCVWGYTVRVSYNSVRSGIHACNEAKPESKLTLVLIFSLEML